MRLRRCETVPALSPHRLASLLPVVLGRDHLRRPRGAPERFRALLPTRKLDRFAAGAQIITGRNCSNLRETVLLALIAPGDCARDRVILLG